LYVTDVSSFFERINSGRENNDKNNKTRENILSQILHFPISHSFFDDPTHGLKWRKVLQEFKKYLQNTFDIQNEDQNKMYDDVHVTQRGGRKFNHDFLVKYIYQNKTICTIPKLEFKNANSFESLPQFLSIPLQNTTKPFINCVSYTKFFYEHYLQEVIKLYGVTDIRIPTLIEYKKYIQSTNYSILPILRYMYDNENLINKEGKSDLVDQSIHDYIQHYGNVDYFNIEALSQKIQNTQTNKIYMLWNGDTFTEYNPELESLKLTEISHLKKNKKGLYNTIVCRTQSGDFVNFLLRWRNHKGILNPAFQISFTPNKSAK